MARLRLTLSHRTWERVALRGGIVLIVVTVLALGFLRPPHTRAQQGAQRSVISALGRVVPGGTRPAARAADARPSQQEIDRVAVIQTYISGLNGGNVGAALSAFADNAVFSGEGACQTEAPCVGTEAIGQEFSRGVGNHRCITLLSAQVLGSVVVGQFEQRGDNIRRAGVERDVATFLAQVPADKITVWLHQLDLTDPPTAFVDAVKNGTQPPGIPIPAPATRCGPA
jgi:hypothetical protein